MCGIAGVVSLSGNRTVPHGALRKMADALVHRGPDDDGYLDHDGVGLANRRLLGWRLAEELSQAKRTGGTFALVHLDIQDFKQVNLRAGQRAEIRVDGFPEKTFTGVVNSVAAGTGARFSLLPPENATGNWVKVVQRVPVKILLDPKEVGNPHTLRAGMSVGVSIRVK